MPLLGQKEERALSSGGKGEGKDWNRREKERGGSGWRRCERRGGCLMGVTKECEW